jgi:hypothetical protein
VELQQVHISDKTVRAQLCKQDGALQGEKYPLLLSSMRRSVGCQWECCRGQGLGRKLAELAGSIQLLIKMEDRDS